MLARACGPRMGAARQWARGLALQRGVLPISDVAKTVPFYTVGPVDDWPDRAAGGARMQLIHRADLPTGTSFFLASLARSAEPPPTALAESREYLRQGGAPGAGSVSRRAGGFGHCLELSYAPGQRAGLAGVGFVVNRAFADHVLPGLAGRPPGVLGQPAAGPGSGDGTTVRDPEGYAGPAVHARLTTGWQKPG